MSTANARPSILLSHDGELADVHDLLAGLGTPFVDRRSGLGLGLADGEASWKLVIASARRMRDFQPLGDGPKPSQIAIFDDEARTLRSMLRRAGVDLIVRRPVHPAALRLLILHALYNGPEKRRALRVTVGAPVRFKAGLFRRNAILADLSLSGARLLCPQPVARGKRITLQLPPELSGEAQLALTARVLRSTPVDSEPANAHTVALRFVEVSRADLARVRKVVSAHASGPAVLEGPVAAASAAPRPAASRHTATEPDVTPSSERRGDARREFTSRVVALGDEASRVLLGRDISLRGMRVDPSPTLALGDELELALHIRARHEPLVVRARVARDDGPEGFALAFHDLPEAGDRYLRKMVNFLPILACRDDDDDATGVILSEVLTRQAG